MISPRTLSLWIFLLFTCQPLSATPLTDQIQRTGYLEIDDHDSQKEMFDLLYAHFDELTEFLQTNPIWAQKLFMAKERFIRSKDRAYYSTDFFGFYDEPGRNQIAFYYSTHFHAFIRSHYPELIRILTPFFDTCFAIQKRYSQVFDKYTFELGLRSILASKYDHFPFLLKVIKYSPSYKATLPHYDGSAFSLFLDSTDNQSLLLSPYKSSFVTQDFSAPTREFSQSILLIPGALLTELSIYPTPHIVIQNDKTRHAAIAFAMRPDFTLNKIEFASLPHF